MTEQLPSTPQNILDLQGADFFAYVGRYCSEDIGKYFELLGVRSIHSLLGINDIFLPLKEDYLELTDIKKKLTFNRPNGTCVIKLGIQHDIDKLFESLENTLVNNEQATTAAAVKEDLVLPSEVIEKYPFLKRLVHFYIKLSQNVNPTDEPFLHLFLENLFSNLSLAKSRYRYNESVIDFALCLSILAGRNAYEFIRLNTPGSLPNLTTIQTKIAKEGFRTVEGEFRYDDMKKYLTTINSTYVYCAEDCTSAVRKIVYDVQSNAFVGFTLPLDEHGVPRIQHFQTNSFEDLKTWFEQKEMSHLINLHMIQPICISYKKTSPFALAAYGTNGKFTYLDVIRRWFKMFEESLQRGVRILGYSTDADPRYLLSMKLVCGFFGTLLNSPAMRHSSLFKVAIPVSWSWFFLPGEQLFLCMQDATHICTKLRNRLLSFSSYMLMGNNTVTIDYLLQLIESKSKFEHNLVKSDICPRDKQNYRSCEKLCASLEYLKGINGSHATVVYLTIIRCVIFAYINTSTTTADRIYHAWLAVFICRLWRVWLHLVTKQELNDRISQANNISEEIKDKFINKKTKNMFFISSPTFLCIEINAHSLIYLTLLVADNQLPVETLKLFSFNSQTCENFFRLSRAISGTFSVSANFSVQQYLHRQEKISILHSIKTETNSSFTNTKFKFPNHHKTQRNQQQSTTLPEKMTKQLIEEQVNRAFQDAFRLLAPLGVEQILKKSKIVNMKQVSQHIHKHFKKSSKKADFLIPPRTDENNVQSDFDLKPDSDSESDLKPNSDSDSESDSESDSDSEQSTIEEDEQNEMDLSDYDSEDEDDDGMNLLGHSTNSRLKTTKGLCDTINPDLKDSYFLVNIDGKKKYLHKNTACWYLTNEKHKLSSDRLNRVMQK